MATKYVSTLTGAQMDKALTDMNNHISEAWAVGERNGTPVTSGDETYNNNAKYYASQAGTAISAAQAAATQAGASASAAATSATNSANSATAAAGSASAAATSAVNAENSAQRAEAIVGGQFISYGQDQSSALTEAQHKTAVYNTFGKATTVTQDFLNKISTHNYLAKIKKLTGKSAVINQLVPTITGTSTEYGITFTGDGKGSVTINGTATRRFYHKVTSSPIGIIGHKYYITKNNLNADCLFYNDGGGVEEYPGVDGYVGEITALNELYIRIMENSVFNNEKLKLVLIDLTAIFESGNEPTTVDSLKSAWLAKFGYPLPNYIPYNSGSIVDTDIKGFGSSGSGYFDGLTQDGYWASNNGAHTVAPSSPQICTLNYIEVKPNTTYRVVNGHPNGSWRWYKEDKTYIGYSDGEITTSPSNAKYVHYNFSTAYGTVYKGGMRILDDSSYYRNFSKTLRSAGNVADTSEDVGNAYKDTYRVGSVDLGTLTWIYNASYGVYYSNGIANSAKEIVGGYSNPNGICSTYKLVRVNSVGALLDGQISYGRDGFTTNEICVKTTTTPTGTLNYELATPIVEYHSYNLTYPVTENGTEYFDSPISVPCEIEYGIDALTDIVKGVISGDTERDSGSFDLLWENASPTSTFNQQDISISVAGYGYVGIICRLSTNEPNRTSMFIYKNDKDISFVIALAKGNSYGWERNLRFIDGGVRFYNAIKAGTNDNNVLIPYRVYGIK